MFCLHPYLCESLNSENEKCEKSKMFCLHPYLCESLNSDSFTMLALHVQKQGAGTCILGVILNQ